MRIQHSDVTLASAHLRAERHAVSEQLNAWVGERPTARNGSPSPRRDRVDLSGQHKPKHAACTCGTDDDDGSAMDPRLRAIALLLEKLTGHKITILHMQPVDREAAEQDAREEADRLTRQQQSVGWGVEYDYHESHDVVEQSDFQADGVVQTADGRQISFSVSLTLARAEHSETNVGLRLGDAARKKDPLVIDFAGTPAELTDAKFTFDLDADGSPDQVSFVGPGSGFLVFDRNADGVVNDGSELFGPATGDGFSELAALDADGNGWIDEGDAPYSQLAVWTKDADGHDQLTPLQQQGVGAVYAKSVATPFQQAGGEVVSSGVYLNENGTAGAVQQLDLYV